MPMGTSGLYRTAGPCLQIQYHKKARGLLTAECVCEIPVNDAEREIQVTGEIKNEEGEVVATATATWHIGPEKKV